MKLNKQDFCKRGQGTPKRVPRRSKRFVSLLVAMLLIFGVAVSGTAAFIAMKTDSIVNTFAPSNVSCEVEEDFNGIAKENIAVTNTGDTQAYIRVAVNVTWMKNNENSNPADQTVTAQAPRQNQDYSITYFENTGWFKGSDGYWYYQSPVAPGETTNRFIKSCGQLSTANVPQGYHLSVEIVASAIQSTPETVVSTKWNVTVADGKITKANGSEVTGE